MKFKYIIVTMDGDIFGCNDEDIAREHSEEDMVVDVEEGTFLGTKHSPASSPLEEITELPSDTSADDSNPSPGSVYEEEGDTNPSTIPHNTGG